MFSVWLKTEEKFRETKYRKRSLEGGQEVHFCEPKQGIMLGEDDEEDERLDESLMECLECTYQYKGKIPKASTKTKESHGFKTKICVNV